jgi:hypothetical protein
MIIGGVTKAAKRRIMEAFLASGEWYIALFTNAADVHALTEKYAATGESSGPGYKAGGKALEGGRVEMDGDVACITFNDAKWPVCTIDAYGALIYDRKSKDTMVVIDFGGKKVASNGPFTVFMPLASRDTALLRV